VRRHSASGRLRRHVSILDIGYELTSLLARPSKVSDLTRQGRFRGKTGNRRAQPWPSAERRQRSFPSPVSTRAYDYNHLGV